MLKVTRDIGDSLYFFLDPEDPEHLDPEEADIVVIVTNNHLGQAALGVKADKCWLIRRGESIGVPRDASYKNAIKKKEAARKAPLIRYK